jgi:peptidoglycan biosynthesis protein MviN/MurJ (putative lipid II flippase)
LSTLRTRVELTALTLLSSLISFAGYTVFLRYLGGSGRVDLIFYASSVPTSLAAVLSGTLLYLLPPTLLRLTERNQISTLRVLSRVIVAGAALVVLIATLFLLLRNEKVFWILLIGFVVVAASSLLSTLTVCLAQVRGAYLLTAVSSFISSVGVLSGAVVAIWLQVSWLIVVGQLLGLIAAVWWLRRALLTNRFGDRQKHWLIGLGALAPIRAHTGAILLGTTAFTLFQPIDAALCTRLGPGAVTTMAYTQRLVVAAATAISLGAYVTAARTSYEAVKAGNVKELCSQANREVGRIALFGLIGWVTYVFIGKGILGFLLATTSMSPEDLTRLLDTVKWMLLGMGPMAAMPYLFRVFYSFREFRVPAALGLGIVCGYAVLAFALLHRLGILSLPIAYTSVWWCALAVSLKWLPRAARASLSHSV